MKCKCECELWFWRIEKPQIVLTCSNCKTEIKLGLGASLASLLANLAPLEPVREGRLARLEINSRVIKSE